MGTWSVVMSAVCGCTLLYVNIHHQARRQLNWNGGGMDSEYKLLSELLSDQAAFITSPKTSLANYWGGIAPLAPPVSTGLCIITRGIV